MVSNALESQVKTVDLKKKETKVKPLTDEVNQFFLQIRGLGEEQAQI